MVSFRVIFLCLLLCAAVGAETRVVTPLGGKEHAGAHAADGVFLQVYGGRRTPLKMDQPNTVTFTDPEKTFVAFTKEGFVDHLIPMTHEGDFKPDFSGRAARVKVDIKVFPSDAVLRRTNVSAGHLESKQEKEEEFPGYAPPYWLSRTGDRHDQGRLFDSSRNQWLMLEFRLEHPHYETVKLPPVSAENPSFDPVVMKPKAGLAHLFSHYLIMHRDRLTRVLPLDFLLLAGVLAVPLGLAARSRRRVVQTRLDALAAFAAESGGKDPNVGKVVGNYRLIDRLGRGGMAIVYRAVPDDTLETRDQVALKLMSPELAQDADFRARFQREVEVSCTLQHPNIVRVDDWGEQDGLLYLVMEVVEGDTFKGYMQKPMELDMFLNLFGQVCQGLTYAHEQGIIHRDLKPANIMVNQKGIVKIMDLGLAKSTRAEHDVTKTGDALGTPAYMPPEQISGGELSTATDQYAMGVMAFEMLTGRLPFEGKPDDAMALILQHLNEPPPPLREWRPKLPQALEQIVNRMLAKKAEERYPSMAEVQKALEEAVEVGDAFATQVMEAPRDI